MNKNRKFKMNIDYKPLPVNERDEIFRNGIFLFNISRIMEHINKGDLDVEEEQIDINEWFKTHWHTSVNEDHLPTVDITQPTLQAEISPNIHVIIDGNHRIEKAFRDGVSCIHSYKMSGEQLVAYLKDVRGYEAYIKYWNSKL
ncbi:hypothetical protein [Oceanobacillus rekensis]|uniref:hypothetical protein n=1 Tax=Oceanobacillus rekensis TaxID=937927 RepID=UPI001FE73D58|nr:hypothetical protein [Oceanobacillus rekensis]